MTHDDDFRLDCENPPPWKYFVAVGTRQDALPIDPRSRGWAQLLRQFDYEEVYASNVLYRTPGVNPDALIRAGRARMLVLGVALGVVIGITGDQWLEQMEDRYGAPPDATGARTHARAARMSESP